MKTIGLIFLHWNCTGTEGGWTWYFPFLFFLLFLLMCFLFRDRRRRYYSCGWPGWFGYRHYDKTDAKDILKKRYAKGDLSREEYDKMMREIS